MHHLKSVALTGIAVAALALSACTNTGISPQPSPGQGTGSANASQPQAEQPTVGTVSTPAPEGGAAARVGEDETVITKVACAVVSGRWTMSGSDDAGAKVAVTGSEDRQSVETASVVMADGRVAQVIPGKGSATISWSGETFTVTAKGELINLNSPDGPPAETDFVITATCQS